MCTADDARLVAIFSFTSIFGVIVSNTRTHVIKIYFPEFLARCICRLCLAVPDVTELITRSKNGHTTTIALSCVVPIYPGLTVAARLIHLSIRCGFEPWNQKRSKRDREDRNHFLHTLHSLKSDYLRNLLSWAPLLMHQKSSLKPQKKILSQKMFNLSKDFEKLTIGSTNRTKSAEDDFLILFLNSGPGG